MRGQLRAFLAKSLSLFLALAASQKSFGDPAIGQGLKQAFHAIKEQQAEKSRSALAALSEQVQSDVDPAKRLQAAIMLAAYYWESNYRLSRSYLGIAESLRNPASPELSRFDAEIEHMKVRFRHAALLDLDTKKELETQLKANPMEPLRLSLVEMLLDTNDALAQHEDFISVFRSFYSSYPRTMRKDRFLKKASDIYFQKNDFAAYFLQLEILLDQYPVNDEAKAALEKLIDHAQGRQNPRYAFTYPLFKKVFRNSSHDPSQQKKVLALMNSPLRKSSKDQPSLLNPVEQVKFLAYLQLYDEAIASATQFLKQDGIDEKMKRDLQNWSYYILSEKGDHASAMQYFAQQNTGRGPADLVFQESFAKSHMSSQKYSEAAKLYAQLLKRKDQPRYRWYYFWNALASGNIDSARLFMTAQGDKVFNEKEFKRDAAIYWKGRTLLSQGHMKEANDLFQVLFTRQPLGYYGLLAKTALSQSKSVLEKSKANPSLTAEAATPASPNTVLAAFKPMESAASVETRKDAAITRQVPEEVEAIPFSPFVFEIAKGIEMDPFLILAIIRSESAFNSRALSTAGAQGLMQLMPYTAVRLAKLLDDQDFRLDQLQSTDTNILYGSLYLSLLLQYYGGHEVPAIAAYNAGPQVVNKWIRECQNCPVDAFVEFIPYAETRNYVKKVLNTFAQYRQIDPTEADYLQKPMPLEFPDITVF